MLPYSYTFYKMLKKYIPVLTDEELIKSENHLVRRDELRGKLHTIPKYYFLSEEDEEYLNTVKSPVLNEIYRKYHKSYVHSDIKDDIDKIVEEIKGETKNKENLNQIYYASFKAIQKLWIARRQYAYEQGHLLQIPTTVGGLLRFIWYAIKYYYTLCVTLPTLWYYKIKYFFKDNTFPKAVVIFLTVLSMALVISVVIPAFNPPLVSDIPDQTKVPGNNFDNILLDNYVSDGDNEIDELIWSFHGHKKLKVILKENRMITIIAPDSAWVGSEVITFTATDSNGYSGSDDAIFTIIPINTVP